ncbi:hypothetical protein Pst134EA_027896 [Puccinia striiformis f. sp. tritici]|uniref:hypothetical protein n=1 Tax=Puccinia striiformis f. sp. tritici TaxID=168172 RepID=UPI002007F11D|nr:hypothetical protein Pst134EA_027896 [Puccinia striiformis f. sp. tritici]KAH9448587.1 hypothetical protein Pst134EA_027896 [Puccinia striiformis f. sp. tritici]
MRGYQGEGGKKQRRTKKPRTQQGIALIAEVERGSQDFASTLQPQTAPPPEQNTLTTNDLQQEHEYHPIENNNHETEALPIDHRVRELQAYLESEDYRLKKILEEKHWEEVYEQMFSKFYECAAQTSNWGDITKWNHDWKPGCACRKTRTRPVVLVDILTRTQDQVSFCECQPDQVRLIQMGYIGGTPKFPGTAFSIRLLRLHHFLWKRTAVTMSPFSKSIDEFLDACNPLILVSNESGGSEPSYQTREWRRTMSSAVDAFREMLRREQLITELMMNMKPLDKLAAICPKCFGPYVGGKREDEAHHHVCMDANFQQRRHLKASVELPLCIKTPSLFVEPEEVSNMAQEMIGETQSGSDNNVADRCTQQHTAADDVRNGKTWKACDETGLFGMACRHDQILQLINIVQSGEKAHFPMTMIKKLIEHTKEGEGYNKKLAFLYDIGCNIEKGIIRRNQFPEHLESNLLSFGTSVFHAYVHQWSCQLRYNPRLNDGWGMSDGEGMERIWSFLSPLIRPLRYATKNHRLVALNIRSSHHNEMGRIYAVKLLFQRGKHIEEEKKKSNEILLALSQEFGHTLDYLKGQWIRQKEVQLSVMENETEKETLKRIEELVELEDKLRETNREVEEIRQTRRRNRTLAQRRLLDQFPETRNFLEGEINALIVELGSDNFRNLPGASDSESKALMKLRVSKSNLYEAKVGVIEMQKKWDRGGSGTRVQDRYKKQMNTKIKLLKKKWFAYDNRAQNYNSEFEPRVPLDTPTLEEVKSFMVGDSFWNMGPLSHPDEPWAVDLNVQRGIEAYLSLTHCEDELHLIAREARQAVKWGICQAEELDQLYFSLYNEPQAMDVLTAMQLRLKNIAVDHGFSKMVLQSIFCNLAKSRCRLWMSWNLNCVHLLSWSKRYVELNPDPDEDLLDQWRLHIAKTKGMWARLVAGEPIIMEVEDQADHEEEEILDQEAIHYAEDNP